MKLNNIKKIILDTLFVIIGNAIVAFGIAAFAVPSNLIVGGATGLSLIIGHFIPINYAVIVFLINLVMLILGYVILGRKFALGTIASSLVFPSFLALYESIPAFQHLTSDMLLSAIYAGIFIGLGLGIVLRLGYSTGGMDIPPIILNKKTGISVALLINFFDIVILIGQAFFSSFEGVLYGIITVLVTTFIIDRVTVLGEKNLQIFVISDKHEEISKAIFDTVNRGCTFVNVTTGYYQKNQKAVLCVANNRECTRILDQIKKIDPQSFVISSEIHSVKGKGFSVF